MSRILTILLAGTMALPVLSLAQDTTGKDATKIEAAGEPNNLRYTFIEGSWITQDLDDFDIDGEGYAVHGGMRLDRHLHLFADYARTNLDPGGLDFETSLVGFGYAFILGETWDLNGRAGWARAKLVDIHDDGWGVQAVVRGQFARRFELEAGPQYVDFGSDADSDTSFLVALRFNVTPWFSVGVNGSVGGDVTEYGASIRFALE